MLPLRRRLLGAAGAAAAANPFGRACAQAFPTRPLKIVVGFTPGAASDIIARALADKLAPALGQPVVVENKPGASTIIASGQVAKSPPDGHTLLINLALHVQNQSLYRNMPYDIFKDFVGVTDICASPVMLIINGSNPARTVKEFIDWGRGRKLSYASWGNGSTGHLLGHVFAQEAKLDATHIGYKGGSPAITDLLGGQVDSIIIDHASTKAHIESGRLRPLAIVLDRRMPQLPNVPTMQEAGISGLDAGGLYGLYAPAGTPKETVQRLSTEVQRIVRLPDVAQRFNELAFIVRTSDPEVFAETTRREFLRWEKIIRNAGVKLEL
jgi:tripartite-type tricarboxylate transporter receptor subunit TctC